MSCQRAHHLLVAGGTISIGWALDFNHWPDLSESFAFFLGAAAVDLTVLFYLFALTKKDRGEKELWQFLFPGSYDDTITERIDREHPFLTLPYKFLHSLLGSLIVFLAVWFIFGWSDALLWFGVGHLTHIVIDFFTHERSYFFAPIPDPAFSNLGNWDELWFVRHWFWRVKQTVVVLYTAGYHWFWWLAWI